MRHVLVIVSEYLVARSMADMALFTGASSVDIVDNANAAIASARKHAPTVIISSVVLSDGGSGPDTVTRIRALRGVIPVIFVADDPEGQEVSMPSATMLPKPAGMYRFAPAMQAVAADITPWRDMFMPDDDGAPGSARH